MGYVLGIDGGGTKTVCVLMDEAGQVLGRGEAGPSNYQSVGIEVAGESIRKAIAQATHSVPEVKVEGIGLGLAGVGRTEDIEVVRDLVGKLQASRELPAIASLHLEKVSIAHDCAIALLGGVGHSVGVVVIAGTGAIAYGQNPQGDTKRASGWGYILGDEGSAYDIAVRGLRAAVRSYDGRLGATLLTKRIIQHLDIKTLEDLVEVVYRRGWGVKQIAALAPLVDEAAAAGDSAAQSIIDGAIEELVLATRVVSSTLFNPYEAFEVVTMGGVWQGMAKMRDRFEASMRAIAPKAKVIWPRHEPAYGAGLLALSKLGQ